jgi:hypothetical protein
MKLEWRKIAVIGAIVLAAEAIGLAATRKKDAPKPYKALVHCDKCCAMVKLRMVRMWVHHLVEAHGIPHKDVEATIHWVFGKS